MKGEVPLGVIVGSTLIVAGLAVVFIVLLPYTGSSTTARDTRSATTAVLVDPGLDGIAFTNDSDTETLFNCEVRLEGEYTAGIAELPARGRVFLGYREFDAGTVGLRSSDGYRRALRQVVLRCMFDGRMSIVSTK